MANGRHGRSIPGITEDTHNMHVDSLSIRTFIGSKDFRESRAFYTYLGFEEFIIDSKMSYFKVNERLGFYLQDHYVKEWIENSMIFLEVDDFERYVTDLFKKDLPSKFEGVRFSEIRREAWGTEVHMRDPSGILWHFGVFKKK